MTSNIDSWVDRIKNAFSSIGTDEDEVYAVLTAAQEKKQIGSLTASYPDLEDELYDEMSGEELKKALRLFYGVPTSTSSSTDISDPSWVSRLYDAFNAGFLGGTDEDAVYDVLQKALDEGQMNPLARAYAGQYPGEPSLEDELYDELSGDELKKALRLYYKGLASDTRVVNRLSIDGTLVPCDPDKPFVPRFPQDKKGSVCIKVNIAPELARTLTYQLRLFSSAGNYDEIKNISEFTNSTPTTIDILFNDASMSDTSTYTLEMNTGIEGDKYNVFEDLPYAELVDDN